MDKTNSIIIPEERKRGEHLGAEERGAIQRLKKLKYSNRAIAREVNCSPSTVGYELKRGTPDYCGKGRKPNYSAKRGAAVYKANRLRCRRHKKHSSNTAFMKWVANKIREHKWSFDICVGRAKLLGLFPAETIPCAKTLYNQLWRGDLVISLFDLPEVLSRRKRGKPRIPKRLNGKSIDLRSPEVAQRIQFGHWESDTVVGKKKKGEPATFTIVEMLTGDFLTIKIDGKTCEGIAAAMEQLHDEFGEQFSQVFKTITTDNGSEFAAFSEFEKYGTQVYFAHPYSSWERPINERSNRILRRYIPKGVSMKNYTAEQVLIFSDEINSMPRKRLGYRTPEELFDEQLDIIYST
ncbi:MAG: IS30 family transposase [Brevinema sp.]